MVVEGSGPTSLGSLARNRWCATALIWTAALAAVLPLLAPAVGTDVRLAQSDPVLSVISAADQPLSVRSPGGVWAIGVALAWFGLAYCHRRITHWETALVLIGGGIALARVGNAWADAALMLLPLGRQLGIARFSPRLLVAVAAVGAAVGVLTLIATRPPDLPAGVAEAVAATDRPGTILAHWRWAAELQRRLGANRSVRASGGVVSESPDFWLDYVRVADGHEQWAAALARMDATLVVLDSADQQRQAAELVRASADWQVLFEARDALVAVRVAP